MSKSLWGFFTDPTELHHLVMFVIVLLVVIVLQSCGKGIGGVIFTALKKLMGSKDISISVGGNMANGKTIPKECEGCGLIVDPTKCVMHQSEHERSKRNEAQIAKLWEEYGKLRNESLAAVAKLKDEVTAGFAQVNASISSSNTQILSALAGNRNDFQGPAKGGSG